jgi:hypothetical protein
VEIKRNNYKMEEKILLYFYGLTRNKIIIAKQKEEIEEFVSIK